jgi:hypothetical protein
VPRAVAGGIALLSLLCWLALPREVAAEQSAPASCRVGAYVMSLEGFDPDGDTFDADLWLWSVCPNDDLHPLRTMEFVNADTIEVVLDTEEPRGGSIWAARKIHGTFRHNWDERDFPFDNQHLTIVLEEGDLDAPRFVYEPDTANTTYNAAMPLPGWTITSFALHPGAETYNTTFGDPALDPGGSSAYSRMTLEIALARADLSGFFKLTAVVYAAFVFSLVTYVMHLETTRALSPQFQILAAALFAAAVNLITASAILGRTEELTLVDKIHVVVLIYILLAAAVVVVARVLVERGWSERAIARLNLGLGALAAISFVVINIVLVAGAIRRI